MKTFQPLPNAFKIKFKFLSLQAILWSGSPLRSLQSHLATNHTAFIPVKLIGLPMCRPSQHYALAVPFPFPLQPLSHLVNPPDSVQATFPPRILSLFLEIHPGRIPNKAPIHSHVRRHLTHLCIPRANHIISNQRGKRLTGASTSEYIDSPCFSGAPGQREALRRICHTHQAVFPGPR